MAEEERHAEPEVPEGPSDSVERQVPLYPITVRGLSGSSLFQSTGFSRILISYLTLVISVGRYESRLILRTLCR